MKQRVVALRKQGYSFGELRKEFGLSKSLLSGWLRDVPLSKSAIMRLDSVVRKGRTLAAENKKAGTRRKIAAYLAAAIHEVKDFPISKTGRPSDPAPEGTGHSRAATGVFF